MRYLNEWLRAVDWLIAAIVCAVAVIAMCRMLTGGAM